METIIIPTTPDVEQISEELQKWYKQDMTRSVLEETIVIDWKESNDFWPIMVRLWLKTLRFLLGLVTVGSFSFILWLVAQKLNIHLDFITVFFTIILAGTFILALVSETWKQEFTAWGLK